MVESTKISEQLWRVVPALVQQRFQLADEIAGALTKQAVSAWYYPDEKLLRVTKAIPVIKLASVKKIEVVAATPAQLEHAICIKLASPFTWLGAPFRAAGSLQGGSSPLSNALVGGLLAGGIGYGSGALLENLFPERYVERGKLRRTMGLMGAGLGAVPGLLQWNANYQNRVGAGESPTWGTFGKGLTAPTKSTPINPTAMKQIDRINNLGKYEAPLWPNNEKQSAETSLDPLLKQASDEFAQMFASSNTGLNIAPIPVDNFNRAIWGDVNRGYMSTSPHIAAAASGLVSGVQAQYGGAPLLSPMHFVRGLATAGVDLATARVAGSVLGALGGLTPEAQNKIQDMGLWGGLIRGVTGSVLGLR
jgi:hypothetical protein